MGLISRKVFKKTKVPYGFKAYDPARNYKQAFYLARTTPSDMPAIVVKTGKRGDIYPYTIYVREIYGDTNATKRLRKKYMKR